MMHAQLVVVPIFERIKPGGGSRLEQRQATFYTWIEIGILESPSAWKNIKLALSKQRIGNR